MSFKREGDDPSQLNLLKKRRVAELLANDIPDDEALLMRNGRYACTVCGHRPVFDTVDMLTIHRHGKKHKKGLDIHHARKRSFAQEIQKRRQEIAIQRQERGAANQVSEAPLLQKTQINVRNALLKAAPYNSRAKSTTSKTGDMPTRNTDSDKKGLFFQTTRKQRLQLIPSASTQSGASSTVEATPTSNLPGNTHPISSSTSDSMAKNPKKSTMFNKNSIFVDDERKPIQLQPYVPKSKRTSSTSEQNDQKPVAKGPTLLSVPTNKLYKPNIASWEQSHTVTNSFGGCTAKTTVTHFKSHDAPQSSRSDLDPDVPTVSEQTHSKQLDDDDDDDDDDVHKSIMKELLKKDAKKNTALEQVQLAMVGKKTEKPVSEKPAWIPNSKQSSRDDATLAEKRRKHVQHHLHLTSSGWKRDNSGNWVKDEDVEFDSDEEAPPDLNM